MLNHLTRRRRRPLLLAVALLALLGLTAAACGSDSDSGSGSSGGDVPNGPAIVIGAQDFGESIILSEIYAQAFSDAGYTASVQEVGGYRDLLFAAFDSGDVNFTLDYVASGVEFLNGPDVTEATGDVDETFALLQDYLAEEGLVAAQPAPGVNTNGFVITRETSEELDITTLSDLAAKGADLRLGAPSDCETNAFCLGGLQETYGLDLSSNFIALDDGRADALTGGEIDVAVLFSTDGIIEAQDLVLLEDDQNMLAADNIVPVMSQALVDAYGEDFVELVERIAEALDTATLTELNKRYDIDREDASAIAADFLSENGLS